MKKVFTLLLLLAVIFNLSGCSLFEVPDVTGDLPEADINYLKNLSIDDVESLKLIVPIQIDEEEDTWGFESKEITRTEDIEKVLNFISEIEFTENEEAKDAKGFDVMIEMHLEDDYYFVFSDNVVIINESGFIIDSEYTDNAEVLYNNADYETTVIE